MNKVNAHFNETLNAQIAVVDEAQTTQARSKNSALTIFAQENRKPNEAEISKHLKKKGNFVD